MKKKELPRTYDLKDTYESVSKFIRGVALELRRKEIDIARANAISKALAVDAKYQQAKIVYESKQGTNRQIPFFEQGEKRLPGNPQDKQVLIG